MTHSPPVPPGNQFPYPIAEPPHPSDTHRPNRPRDWSPALSPGLVIGAVVAAAGLLAAVAALARRRSGQAPVTMVPRRNRTAAGTAGSASRPTRTTRGSATAKTNAKARPKRAARTRADDKTDRGPQDASRIAMGEDYEVRYWTKQFGVDREALQRAVDAVGNGSAAVERELGRS